MPANTLQNNLNKSPQSLLEVWPALAGLSAVFLFEMLDNSILNIALPTIGHKLHASATELQWITSAYAVIFGGLMLLFGALADRYGRRKMMLMGLVLLGAASLMTVLVRTPEELIAVRALMGVAAAMTTPGTIALAFRLFNDDTLRIRAISAITTVGLIGLAAGPIVGGFLLAIAPWQALLLINVPISLLAFIGIKAGIKSEQAGELHKIPIDITGAILGTLAIVLSLIAPTLFIYEGADSMLPWLFVVAAGLAIGSFVVHERKTEYPLVDSKLISQPLVASGLAYKAAAGLAVAGVGYMVSLQLQLDWGWSPFKASFAMLPQVAALLIAGFFVERLVKSVGVHSAAWYGSLSLLGGLVIFAIFGQSAYMWVAVALVLISVGLRVVGVVAGVNVMKGTPKNRTSIGAALVDTTDEITSGVSIAIVGTLIASLFVGNIAQGDWTSQQAVQFHYAASAATWILVLIAGTLIGWAFIRTRRS